MRINGRGTEADPILVRVDNEMINDLVRGKVHSFSFLVEGDRRLIVKLVPALGGRFMTYEEIRHLEQMAWENHPYVKEAKRGEGAWLPVETAPRGSGGNTLSADYVSPPKLLLLAEDGPIVGAYDWYYRPGYGTGAEEGVSPWRDRHGIEIRGVTHWRELPDGPDADH